MFSKNKNMLRHLLVILFAFSLASCGDFNPEVNQQETVTQDGSDGSDGGNGDGGTGGSGDGGTIDPATGSWEKKDEDGDGVLDEIDDFPFDKDKTIYPQFSDIEPNDNPSVAVELNVEPPFRLTGAISNNSDNGDLYAFTGKAGKAYTIILRTSSRIFVPQVYFSDSNGDVLNFGKINLNSSLGITSVAVLIQDDGLYHVGVVDSNFKGDIDFSYTIEVFEDLDVDAIDDIKEAALGINSEKQDTDNDTILDAEEYYFLDSAGNKVLDADGDQIPNWLDDDSDNDGIKDRVEEAYDVDGDGLGNFLDLDSDGNSLLDSSEVGQDSDAPDDFDLDNLHDFRDLDDDGDGLWDVYDSERLKTIAVANGEDLFLLALEAIHPGELTVKNFIRTGDTLFLTIENNLPQADTMYVVFQHGTTSSNVVANLVDNSIQVKIPAGTESVYLTDGLVRSNKRNVQLEPEGAPVMTELSTKEIISGEQITITGVDFSDDVTVLFEGIGAIPDSISSNSVRVTVPEDVKTGVVRINNLVGDSNNISYFVNRVVDITFAPVGGISQDTAQLEAIGGTVAERVGDTNLYQLEIREGSPVAIYSWILDNEGNKTGKSHVSGYSFPSMDSLELGLNSTAIKLIIDFISLSNLDNTRLSETRDAILTYQEYQDVLSHLTTLFDASPSAVDPLETDTVILLTEKASLILAKLDADGLTKSAAAARKFSQSIQKLNALIQSKADGVLKPDITTFESAFFNMSMEATNFLDSWLPSDPKCPENTDVNDEEKAKIVYDGCVELQNRTRLFLSTRIFPLGTDDDYREIDLDNPLRSHISSAYDSNMIGPQDGTFLGIEMWSKDHLYPECPYQNCVYQVIAPGVGDPLGPTPFDLNGASDYDKQTKEARQYLGIRTIVEGILLKYFDLVLVLIDYEPTGFDPVAVTKIMIKYSPSLVAEVSKLYSDDDVTAEDLDAAAYNIVNEFYKNEVEILFDLGNGFKFGPIMSEIFVSMGIETDDLLAITAEALAKQFTPFKGQMEAIIKGAKIADIIIDQVKTIKDMAAVPIKTDFMVVWGLNIVDIDPVMMRAINQDEELRVIGSGFGINERWYWFDEEPITILDDLGRSETLERIKHDSVSEDGTVLTITVPGEYLELAIGRDITVTVEHRGQTAVSPVNIQIGDGLEIARLRPDEGQPGDIVVIDGLGFSSIPSGNTVTFAGKSGARIIANVNSASDNQLTVTVPNGIVTGDVTVEVGGVLSNALVFTVPFVVDITYGDNGNLNDDIYKLVVDGNVVSDGSEPSRKIGPISMAMSAGQHEIQLVGIRAEDEIGTYYIEFEGDVISISGDAQEGRDLLKDTTKTFTIDVGLTKRRKSTKDYLLKLKQEY